MIKNNKDYNLLMDYSLCLFGIICFIGGGIIIYVLNLHLYNLNNVSENIIKVGIKNNLSEFNSENIFINQSYFEGLTGIYFENEHNFCGRYHPTNFTIYLAFNQTYCRSLTKTLLHELKHHYCWYHNLTPLTETNKHTGCFEHTPLDDEYGFIK